VPFEKESSAVPNSNSHSPVSVVEPTAKSYAVMTPAVTVKLFDVTKQLLPQDVSNGRGEGFVKADG
jgi:hypothetical protein